jgi:hypothetical protein
MPAGSPDEIPPMPANTPNAVLRSEESDGVVAAIEVGSPPGVKGPPSTFRSGHPWYSRGKAKQEPIT